MAVAFLVIGAYRPFLVLPVAGAAAAALALATSRTIRSPGRPGPTVLAGAIAFVSWATNTIWSGQYLDSNLDPGTYANAGLWLRGNPTLRIPAPFEVFGSAIPSLIASAPGWPYADGNVYAQGNHGLPALLAAGAWIGGTGGLFRVNALLGAATLLALFALARRLVPGWWAVLPVIVLAVSQPFISIARAQYSEPLAAVCILGGLALTAAAVDRARPWAFALAGFVTGAACLARPDCYLAGVAVIVAAAAASRANTRRWAPLLAGLGGWAVPAALGTLDLLRLSPRYIDGLGERIGFQLALLAVYGVGAAVAIVRRQPGAALPPDGSRNPPARHRNRAAVAAAGTILLVAAGLASRPLWREQHVTLASPGMAGLQRRMGLPIDPSRSYGELSVTWHSWYFGWPVIAVGVIGLAALTADAIRRSRRARAGILAAGLVYSAAYLARPSINGFHVWAMRRFVPLVIPKLLIGCAFILAVVARRSRTGLLLASGAAVVAIAIPAVVTVPLFTIRDNTPALAQFRTQCAAIGDRAAVISLDLSAHRASRTLIGLCG
ncbi:MAG: glycosyltransferase family 39 protein, partial [Actinomycetota bacterium]